MLDLSDLIAGRPPSMKLSADKPEGVILLSYENAIGPEGTYSRAVPLSLVDTSF
jgi:hypothetical protein